MRNEGTYRSVLKVHCLREEIDSNGSLVSVVKTVVHEPSDQWSLANLKLVSYYEMQVETVNHSRLTTLFTEEYKLELLERISKVGRHVKLQVGGVKAID